MQGWCKHRGRTSTYHWRRPGRTAPRSSIVSLRRLVPNSFFNTAKKSGLISTVKSLIVERYPERLGAPKAHALSPRSLEICRQFGLDVAKIRQLGTKRADALWVNFLTVLSGELVGRLPYERMDTGVLDETPEVSVTSFLSQSYSLT